ncbi:MAG: hypothetical protein QME75_03935 [Deltaproteobacteria bacterium]|nr:hypothetical protein [Deltaproteobacteria bacterium]
MGKNGTRRIEAGGKGPLIGAGPDPPSEPGLNHSTGRSPEGQAGAGLAVKSENRKILVVGKEAGFSEAVMDYAVNLAERLGYDLITMVVGPEAAPGGMFNSPYRRYLQEKFKKQAKAAARLIEPRVRQKGLGFEHLVRFGDLGRAVETLNHEKRRIEFVINASEMSEAEMAGGVTLPVFTIKGDQGERLMAHEPKRNYNLAAKTAGLGLATAALYAAVFLNTGTVMKYFTLGGWYAALPIATVFIFSFVHGAFSHHVWEVLGIQAPKKAVQPRPAAAKRPAKRQRPRPRLRLNV